MFWVNLPICLAAIVLAAVFVPESKAATARRFDPVGQVLGVVFMATLVFGLIEGPSMGWTDPRTLALFGVGALGLVGFLAWESRHTSPFIDIRFFRSVPFSTATVVGVMAFAAYGAFLFLMSIYLQDVRGYSAIHAGVLYLPIAVATLVCSPLSGRLVGRYGTRPSLVSAGVLLTAGSILLTLLTPTTAIWQVAVTFSVFGAGFGLVNAPITTSAVSGMPRERAGAASAVASTSRQLGISLGVAVSGTVAGAAIASTGSDFTAAIVPLWWMTAAFAVAIAVLGMVSTTRWAQHTTDRIQYLFTDETSGGSTRVPAQV